MDRRSRSGRYSGTRDSQLAAILPTPYWTTQQASDPVVRSRCRYGKEIFAIGEAPRGELTVYDPKSGLFAKYGSGLSAGFTDFSRDGQWIAYVSHPDGMLWRSRIDGSERLQLTFPPMGPILNPKWSPDGRFILFTDFNERAPKVYLISADSGAPQLLV